MAEKIIMPKAGMAMEVGTIISWLKEVGDKVSYGEPLLEIETDKTSMQVEAMGDGYLIAKLYDAGDEVPVVTTIGYLGEKGEAPPKGEPVPAAGGTEEREPTQKAKESRPSLAEGMQKGVPATPLAKKLAAERGVDLGGVRAEGPVHAKDVLEETPATPLARRMARAEGVDLADVKGSGVRGKVFSGDVARHAPAERREDVLVKFNGMRRTIATRMLESHTQIPPVTLHAEADATELSRTRDKINAFMAARVSFNDLIVKACAIALREHRGINASYTPEGILIKGDINIGMAVALDDGLIVPVLRQADSYGLAEMSEALKGLAEAARDGRLQPEDYSGGTFTISNLGMYGITYFTPIINLPEACILGVCKITERYAKDGQGNLSMRKFMGLSLTFDHRVVDGAQAAKFLQRVIALLENPLEILV